MIIDNARHRMELKPRNPQQFTQQIYSNFTQEEIQTCQLGVETCAAAAAALGSHISTPTNILNCSSGFSNYLTHSRYIITLHGAGISWGRINSLAAAASIS